MGRGRLPFVYSPSGPRTCVLGCPVTQCQQELNFPTHFYSFLIRAVPWEVGRVSLSEGLEPHIPSPERVLKPLVCWTRVAMLNLN